MEDKSNTTEQHSKESEVKQDDLFDLFKNPAKFQPSPATKLRRISTPKRKNREGEEDSERTRTPSGLAITPSVGDLTSIIEKQCYLNNPQKRLNTSAVSASGDCSSVSKHGKQHKHDQSRLSKDSDRRLLSVSSLELHLQSDKLQPTNAEVRSEDQRKMPEENSVRGDIKEGGREIEEQNATDHPTMDIRTVVQMLSELKADLTREFDQKMNNIVASMQKPNIAEDVKKDIQTVKMKTEVCEIKNRMVADTMANLHDRIKELEQRVENQEINANKKAVILSGFEASEKKTVARQQLMNFFTEVLCIDVVMEDFYSIGQNSPRDIAIIFLSANHKRSLFQNIEKIKNLRNTHGKKYVFRDMMTAKQNDFRQRSQQIADGVSRMDSVNREDVTVDKNRIYVGNEEYQEPVTPPNPTSVLRYSSPKLNEIMMKHVDRDPNISEYVKGNKFTAYSMCTDNFVDINDAYMKIRLNHAEARHIICAWNIPGVKRYECEGSCDDDDYGVSKTCVAIDAGQQYHKSSNLYSKELWGEVIRRQNSMLCQQCSESDKYISVQSSSECRPES